MTLCANSLSPATLSERIKTQLTFLDSISSVRVLKAEDIAPFLSIDPSTASDEALATAYTSFRGVSSRAPLGKLLGWGGLQSGSRLTEKSLRPLKQ